MRVNIKFLKFYRKPNGKDKSLQLYDTPKKIRVQTFYEIMETGNLELLKGNPQEKAKEENLNDVWLDLLEYFYSNTNQSAFKKFFSLIRLIGRLEQEVVSCYAAFQIVSLGDESGYDILKKWGIESKDHDRIKSGILRKETKLELARRKLKDNGKEEKISFYKIVSIVEDNLGRQLNLDEINLERWVAYLNDVKEKSKALKKQNNKRKSKQWQGK